MISRYTLPEMGKVWSEQNRFEQMLQVEIYACEAMRDMASWTPRTTRKLKKPPVLICRELKKSKMSLSMTLLLF